MTSGAFGEAIDKVAAIENTNKVTPIIASFLRNLFFFMFTILGGFIGIFGRIEFFSDVRIILTAIICVIYSLAYDYLLRNIELSRFQNISYTSPLIYLFIDRILFHQYLSNIQFLGILLLVLGSLFLSFKRTLRRSILSPKNLLWLFLYIIPQIYLLVIYKAYYNEKNAVSFYFSIWLIVVILIFIIIISKGAAKDTIKIFFTGNFVKRTFISKGFEFVSSISYLKALSLTNLTTVSAFNSFYPLVLFFILLIISFLRKVNIDEDFSLEGIVNKIAAALILTVGGLLVFKF